MYSRGMETVTHSAVLGRFGHALSDPKRARILLTLSDAPAYPSDLAEILGISRQSLSNNLACLRGCGLVVAVPEGRRTRYELADAKIGHALADLLDVVLAVDPEYCAAAARMMPTLECSASLTVSNELSASAVTKAARPKKENAMMRRAVFSRVSR